MAAIGELAKAAGKAFSISRNVDFSGSVGQIDMKASLTAAGLKTDETGALKIAAAWIACTLIADEIGTLKLKLIERGDRTRTPVRPDSLRALWDRPNVDQTPMEWRVTNALSLALYGVVIGQLGWTRGDELAVTWPIEPTRTKLERADHGGLRLTSAGQGELHNRPGRRPEFFYTPAVAVAGPAGGCEHGALGGGAAGAFEGVREDGVGPDGAGAEPGGGADVR